MFSQLQNPFIQSMTQNILFILIEGTLKYYLKVNLTFFQIKIHIEQVFFEQQLNDDLVYLLRVIVDYPIYFFASNILQGLKIFFILFFIFFSIIIFQSIIFFLFFKFFRSFFLILFRSTTFQLLIFFLLSSLELEYSFLINLTPNLL